MLSIEFYKGIQDRDEIINALLKVCITAHDALLSLHVCDLDIKRCDDLRKQLREAIEKAAPKNIYKKQ